MKRKDAILAGSCAMDFFLGGVVTNQEWCERAQVNASVFFKLRKKVEAARALLVINEIGLETLAKTTKSSSAGSDAGGAAAVGGGGERRSSLVLQQLAAFHQGKIPGVVVTDEPLALAERHGAQRRQGPRLLRRPGSEARRRRARSRLDGVYLGRWMPAADLRRRSSIRPLRSAATTGRSSPPRSTYPVGGDESDSSSPHPKMKLSSGRGADAAVPARLEARRRKTELRVPFENRFSRSSMQLDSEQDAPLFPGSRRAFDQAVDKVPPAREGGPTRSSRRPRCRSSCLPRLRRSSAARHR